MSVPVNDERAAPISGKRELVEYMASGSKPRSAWRIGTEHEKFGYRLSDLRPLSYEGPQGIAALFEGLKRFGWTPVHEGNTAIGMAMGRQSISLEPGGQFELSGAPLATLHQTCDEVNTHLAQVKTVATEMGIGFLGLGFHPKSKLDDVPIMPKGRYAIMRRYMPKVGGRGLDMMFRTCTVQVNLDFGSEADMVKKLRVALALQPIATALFANSPFVEGKPSGDLSSRSRVWTDTDPARTGMLPFAFESGMGFERYVDYALDVPMYFVFRKGQYVDVAGQSFRDFMRGKLAGLPGELPTMADWGNHLTTCFPEARLKTYLEMRGADGGPWKRLCALPAFWVGLLYDDTSLDAAWDLVKDWTAEERQGLRDAVPKTALATPFRKTTVRDLARLAVELSEHGLARRNRLSSLGGNEAHFVNTLKATVESGKTPAEELLEAYRGRWQGRIEPVFEEYSY
ncbi:MAG: glutamate--cysteine ligase [Alphaproteobacteria bacterium]|nr:glutamate--cysteine ligase [Alphaproteobacteria bacterium]